MAKKSLFLVKKVLGQPTKHNCELKMLQLLENHVKIKVWEGFSHFLKNLGPIFENFDHKVPKSPLLPKNHFLVKFGYQKWILGLISIPKMYTFTYIIVIVLKLWHSLIFQNFWVDTKLKAHLLVLSGGADSKVLRMTKYFYEKSAKCWM